MLRVAIIMEMLFVARVCQSLTIYQFKNKPFKAGPFVATMSYQGRALADILSGSGSLQQSSTQLTTARPEINSRANQQPAVADYLKSEIIHERKTVRGKDRQEASTVNYDTRIYHVKSVKKASPLANNEQEKQPKLIVRKQRNLKENHDDKLIEQNIDDMENANEEENDQHYTEAAASLSAASKQPSMLPSRPPPPPSDATSHEIRYLHDIFLNYPRTHYANFGHVELSPVLFEKRFQSQKLGNRYRGEIMWLDNTGGFAHHYWDLAQGRL